MCGFRCCFTYRFHVSENMHNVHECKKIVFGSRLSYKGECSPFVNICHPLTTVGQPSRLYVASHSWRHHLWATLPTRTCLRLRIKIVHWYKLFSFVSQTYNINNNILFKQTMYMSLQQKCICCAINLYNKQEVQVKTRRALICRPTFRCCCFPSDCRHLQ